MTQPLVMKGPCWSLPGIDWPTAYHWPRSTPQAIPRQRLLSGAARGPRRNASAQHRPSLAQRGCVSAAYSIIYPGVFIDYDLNGVNGKYRECFEYLRSGRLPERRPRWWKYRSLPPRGKKKQPSWFVVAWNNNQVVEGESSGKWICFSSEGPEFMFRSNCS